MIRSLVFAGLVLAHGAPLAPAPRLQGQGTVDSSSEMLSIDGARNPELVPQWSAWGFAFRVIAGGPRELPSSVLRVVSSEEAAMVLEEAEAIQIVDKGCEERVAKLRPLVGKEKYQVLDARLRAITLECRRKTLEARDRVLLALNPAGAAALSAFVEATKSGTTLTIRRRDLARFLEPE